MSDKSKPVTTATTDAPKPRFNLDNLTRSLQHQTSKNELTASPLQELVRGVLQYVYDNRETFVTKSWVLTESIVGALADERVEMKNTAGQSRMETPTKLSVQQVLNVFSSDKATRINFAGGHKLAQPLVKARAIGKKAGKQPLFYSIQPTEIIVKHMAEIKTGDDASEE
jgi:hypothetical protein